MSVPSPGDWREVDAPGSPHRPVSLVLSTERGIQRARTSRRAFVVGVTFLTRADLRAQGLTSTRQINDALRHGSLIRLERGRYLDKKPTQQQEQLLLRRDAGDALALESAALLHGLEVAATPRELLLARAGTNRVYARGRRRIYVGRLPESHLTEIDGTPVTSVARTIVDIARMRSTEDALIPWESALWQARTSPRDDGLGQRVDEVLEDLRGFKGIDRARFLHRFAGPWSQSPMESLSRLAMVGLGMPLPIQQFEVLDSHGLFLGFTDFAWPDLGVLGEYDGLDKYERLARPGETAHDVVLRERVRQHSMELEGWVFARWQAAEVREPQRLLAVFERAVKVASRRRH